MTGREESSTHTWRGLLLAAFAVNLATIMFLSAMAEGKSTVDARTWEVIAPLVEVSAYLGAGLTVFLLLCSAVLWFRNAKSDSNRVSQSV